MHSAIKRATQVMSRARSSVRITPALSLVAFTTDCGAPPTAPGRIKLLYRKLP